MKNCYIVNGNKYCDDWVSGGGGSGFVGGGANSAFSTSDGGVIGGMILNNQQTQPSTYSTGITSTDSSGVTTAIPIYHHEQESTNMDNLLQAIGFVVCAVIVIAFVFSVVYSVMEHFKKDDIIQNHETKLNRLQNQIDGMQRTNKVTKR